MKEIGKEIQIFLSFLEVLQQQGKYSNYEIIFQEKIEMAVFIKISMKKKEFSKIVLAIVVYKCYWKKNNIELLAIYHKQTIPRALAFLPDPGVPGVRSIGPDLCHYESFLKLCWCDSGWCRVAQSAGT